MIGVILFALGILWNLAGTQFGGVPANAAFGLIAVLAGIFYWTNERRLQP